MPAFTYGHLGPEAGVQIRQLAALFAVCGRQLWWGRCSRRGDRYVFGNRLKKGCHPCLGLGVGDCRKKMSMAKNGRGFSAGFQLGSLGFGSFWVMFSGFQPEIPLKHWNRGQPRLEWIEMDSAPSKQENTVISTLRTTRFWYPECLRVGSANLKGVSQLKRQEPGPKQVKPRPTG